MTDLVKRATVGADELEPRRVPRRARRASSGWCEWLRPGAICFVGLAGYRAAVDRHADAGVQPEPFGGVPAYVMPNTSGLNAHATPPSSPTTSAPPRVSPTPSTPTSLAHS